MPGPVLITGAAGFAGSHLIDLLAGDGVPLVAWRRPGGTRPRSAEASRLVDSANIRWDEVDALDRGGVSKRIAELRPSVVYHCAGAAHVARSWETTESTFAINVRGTHYLIEALRDHAVDARVLIPSSAMVYAASTEPLREGDPAVPSSPYGLSKLATELLAVGQDRPSILLARPFNHFGPRQSPAFATSGFAKQIAEIEAGRAGRVLAVGNLEARRDMTDVRDTVKAYRLIAERGVPGRPYNICSGRAVAIRDLLDMLLARSRAAVTVTVDPARYRPNDVPLIVGDPGRVMGELGWTPTMSLERGIDDLLDYWRRQTADAG